MTTATGRRARLTAWLRTGRWEIDDRVLGRSVVIGPGRMLVVGALCFLGLVAVVVLGSTYGAVVGETTWPNAMLGWLSLLAFAAGLGIFACQNAVVLGQRGFRVGHLLVGRPEVEATWQDVRVIRYRPDLWAPHRSEIVCRDRRTGDLVTKHLQTPLVFSAPLWKILELMVLRREEATGEPPRT